MFALFMIFQDLGNMVFCAVLLPDPLVILKIVATIFESELSVFQSTLWLSFALSCGLLLSSCGFSVLLVFCSAIYAVYSLYLKSE